MHYPPPYSPTQEPTPSPVTPELLVTLATDPTTHEVLISLVPPKGPESCPGSVSGIRAPVDICCVIDVSGSMDSELKASLAEGQAAERTGLSTLDVVKHAVRTIVETTLPNDRISIVTFSNSAKVIAGLTPMTVTGKAEVLQAVQTLHTLDSTNLWEGLKLGMNVLNALPTAPIPSSRVASTAVSPARFSTLFLLTDGMPNINPPRGIIQMLKSYINTHPLNFSIHTFGFGYSLDSQLLLQISRLGGGAYGFIPDASALGAVFIHAVANLYSTCADRVELNVEYPANGGSGIGSELEILVGHNNTSGAKIEVGTVQYGQTRDFVVSMKNYSQLLGNLSDPVLSVTVQYRPWTHGPGEKPLTSTTFLTQEAIATGSSAEDHVRLKHHSYRLSFIRAVNNLFESTPASLGTTAHAATPRSPRFAQSVQSGKQPPSLDVAVREFRFVLSSLESPLLSAHSPAAALAQDITGEVFLALSADDVYARWGQHYLPSLARYHILQQCGSFRDPGLQVYGANSPLFLSSRDALDQAFDSLPPPEQTINRRLPHFAGSRFTGPNGHFTLPQYRGQRRMSAVFASRSGPCFDGTCEIALAGGQKVPLRDLRRDMRVETPKGARTVVAVLETPMEARQALLCELPGGLKITPWHPIKVDSGTSGRWVFPASQKDPELQACDAVYSLLLEPEVDPDAHGVYIQGMLCVTLGHGITHKQNGVDPDVRTHEFLGDYTRVVQSLASFPDAGAHDGVFRLEGVSRHGGSGRINGFIPCNELMTAVSSVPMSIDEITVA